MSKLINQLSFEECSFERATHFQLANSFYSLTGGTASKRNEEVSLRIEFDRWAEFNVRDFEKVGIKCLKAFHKKPKEFVAKMVEVNGQKCLIIPKGYEASEYKCIEIVKDDSCFETPAYQVKYNSIDPHWYIQDSNGHLWGRFFSQEEAQKEVDILMY